MKNVLRAAVFAAATLCVSWAQTFGEIGGQVRDQSGAAIAGANVTATNVATNATRTSVSNEAGIYSFPSLPPGVYNLRVESPGFKSATRQQVELQVQQSARLDFNMELGQVTETVEVSATAALLASENATIGTVIENKRIVELPLNGRELSATGVVGAERELRFSIGGAGTGPAGRPPHRTKYLRCRPALPI